MIVHEDTVVATKENGMSFLYNLEDGPHEFWVGRGWSKGTLKTVPPVSAYTYRFDTGVKLKVNRKCKFVGLDRKPYIGRKGREVALSFKIDHLEPKLEYPPGIGKIEFMPRYDLGVLMFELESAELVGSEVRLYIPSNEIDRVREMHDILSVPFDYSPVFDARGGEGVIMFRIYYPDLMKLNDHSVDWIMPSMEACRGYLRAVVDNAEIFKKHLRITHRAHEILTIWFGFMGIVTKAKHKYVWIEQKYFHRLFMNLGVMSDKQCKAMSHSWDGIKGESVRAKTRITYRMRGNPATKEITTDGAQVCVNGVIVKI